MKKLALVIGSLLVVSAVASAKEVVPAPKAVAPEVPVKVVTKEVIVYRDKLVEAPKAWAPKGSFELSYGFDLDKFELKENATHTMNDFYKFDKTGTLEASARVEFVPKHTVYANASTKLELIPNATITKTTEDNKEVEKREWNPVGAKDALSSVKVGYVYKYNDMAKLDLSLKHEGKSKTLTVAPTFDVKEYFFKTDAVKVTKLAFVPKYAFGYTEIYGTKPYNHTVSAGFDAAVEGPYGVELGVDLKDFFVANIVSTPKVGNVDATSVTTMTGKAGLSLSKDFALYENGKHTVDLGTEASYSAKWAWNEKAQKNKKSFLEDSIGAKAELKYGYKINNFAKVYANLGASFESTLDRTVTDAKRENTLTPSAKVGLKVTF